MECVELKQFKEAVKAHAGRVRIKNELKELATCLLMIKWTDGLFLDVEEGDGEKTDEENAPYFFQRFFFNEGKNFKKRSYNKNWYEIN